MCLVFAFTFNRYLSWTPRELCLLQVRDRQNIFEYQHTWQEWGYKRKLLPLWYQNLRVSLFRSLLQTVVYHANKYRLLFTIYTCQWGEIMHSRMMYPHPSSYDLLLLWLHWWIWMCVFVQDGFDGLIYKSKCYFWLLSNQTKGLDLVFFQFWIW